ncbi:MAG TPA: WD40 repeat domain-containing protein [Candidatus Babeliales bacterium]|jgi:WD40 repeat protein|nr:WD40 repeat domain-containing protein [Candidatus Babeliales bacterium]
MYHLLIAIHVLLAITSCSAMNKFIDIRPNIITTIAVKKPKQAAFLTNNLVIINHRNGCGIFDLHTHKEVKKITDIECEHFAIHPHNQIIAISRQDGVTLYNIKTGTNIDHINNHFYPHPIISTSFSPLTKNIIIRYEYQNEIIDYDYANKTSYSWQHTHNTTMGPPKITFHPTQPYICFGHGCTPNSHIDIFDYKAQHKNPYNKTVQKLHTEHINFCEWSPNGSFFAHGNQYNVNVIQDPLDWYMHITKLSIEKDDEQFVKIKFHPNSFFIATLSSPNHIVCYWDVTTYEPMSCLSLLFADTICSAPKNSDLAFSDDGKKLIVTLNNKCVILPVPFELIYQPEAKELLPYFLFILKNYQQMRLPQDIIRELIYTVLETFKR